MELLLEGSVPHGDKPVFRDFSGLGFEGSGRRCYHWIELVESYLEHYLTQLEHIPGRILGGNTRIRRQLHLRFSEHT